MIAGIAMAFSSVTVVLNALRLKGYKFKNYEEVEKVDKIKVSVPSMSCGHCKMSIEKALQGANLEGTVLLDSKEVELNNSDLEVAVDAIEAAGYPVER
jgi:cation transport ATPase